MFISEAEVRGGTGNVFDCKEPVGLKFKIEIKNPDTGVWFGYNVRNERGTVIFTSRFDLRPHLSEKTVTLFSEIPGRLLISAKYSVLAAIYVPNSHNIDTQEGIVGFEILDTTAEYEGYNPDNGCVFVETKWKVLN